jgi:hypothetical protein
MKLYKNIKNIYNLKFDVFHDYLVGFKVNL